MSSPERIPDLMDAVMALQAGISEAAVRGQVALAFSALRAELPLN